MSISDQTLFLGVDGGGTGCRAAIGTAAHGILARAEAGPANATSDPDQAIKNIRSASEAAAQLAGLPQTALSAAIAHVGLAGVMTDQDSARIAAALPCHRCTVTDDRPTAVTGALGRKDGFLVSIGTGTIVAASKAGTFNYVSGWGFHVSDQASGAWLGRAALEQVILCQDHLADFTPLTRSLFAKFKDDPNRIVAFAKSAHPGDYASLAPEIIAAARAGDPWGSALMTRGAVYVMQCLTALGFSPGDTLCLSGGVGPFYADFLPNDALSGRTPPRGNALDGAFLLAKASHAQHVEGIG